MVAESQPIPLTRPVRRRRDHPTLYPEGDAPGRQTLAYQTLYRAYCLTGLSPTAALSAVAPWWEEDEALPTLGTLQRWVDRDGWAERAFRDLSALPGRGQVELKIGFAARVTAAFAVKDAILRMAVPREWASLLNRCANDILAAAAALGPPTAAELDAFRATHALPNPEAAMSEAEILTRATIDYAGWRELAD